MEVILASYALNLGRSWWTIASLIATHANFYLTTWEEYHTGTLHLSFSLFVIQLISGQLYLGVFSGPVEGIIMIILIYVFTGIFGPAFWDQPLGAFFPFLYHLLPKVHVPFLAIPLQDLPLNVVFMILAALGLGFNIITSYHNVRKSRRAADSRHKETHESVLRPLLLLLPFLFPTFVHLLWLSQSASASSSLLHSPLFLPFICAWGLQFAHQVGRMILSHVTKMPFPMWDNLWLVTLVGAADACLPRLLGMCVSFFSLSLKHTLMHSPCAYSHPIIQYNTPRTAVLVFIALLASTFVYARFCYRVIRDVTEFLGIACFTVRKKDEKGVWRRTAEVDNAGVQMNGAHGAHGHNGLNLSMNGLLPAGCKRKM